MNHEDASTFGEALLALMADPPAGNATRLVGVLIGEALDEDPQVFFAKRYAGSVTIGRRDSSGEWWRLVDVDVSGRRFRRSVDGIDTDDVGEWSQRYTGRGWHELLARDAAAEARASLAKSRELIEGHPEWTS